MTERSSFGERFASRRMAENYRFRPPYPPEVFDTLRELLRGHPPRLLDAGCGPGKVALGLIDHVDHVDAVDPSVEMLHVARAQPKGSSPKVRWIRARCEDAPLNGPYGLIVAGASIHWMELDRVLTRFSDVLVPGGFLAVLDGDAPIDPPWEREETAFMIDFVASLEAKRPAWYENARQRLEEPVLEHPTFNRLGRRITAPFAVSQSIDDYLRCQHSRATWSIDHLGESAAEEFDAVMTALLRPHAKNGIVDYVVQTRIEWGELAADVTRG